MMAKLQELRNELGWQGMSGIVLLVLGLIFSTTVMGPQEQRASEMRDRADSYKERSMLSSDMQHDEIQSPSVMLQRFYGFFTSDEEITDHLARIYGLAESSGLILREGDYKVVHDKGGRMTQYQILLPVTGSYNQIRGFAALLLDKIPVISLDQIKFERKHANDPSIEAQIMITLYIVRP